jgi:hypothetical protein
MTARINLADLAPAPPITQADPLAELVNRHANDPIATLARDRMEEAERLCMSPIHQRMREADEQAAAFRERYSATIDPLSLAGVTTPCRQP